MTVIFTAKKPAALGLGKKLPGKTALFPQAKLATYARREDDILYLDISGMEKAALKKAIALLKKTSLPWGIIDPKGEAPDPAEFFFAGASDYIGPKIIKEGLKGKRLAAALLWKLAGKQTEKPGKAEDSVKVPKLPLGKFEGWSSIRAGTTANFFFLFVSIDGGQGIRGTLGEAAFTSTKNRFRAFLQQRFESAKALLWMETESNSLLLIPPRAPLIRQAVLSSLKIIMAAPLIGIENLGLSIPVRFTFALHYGKTAYHAPGRTGTVISDAVNFIFHLGTNRAEPGRLTVSGETPPDAIPEELEDMFQKAGEFEGRDLRHSRRFAYLK
jgi:hypothetical protein